MTKFFNKWLRKFHRWLSVPTFLSIPLMLFTKITHGAYLTLSPQFEAIQQLLIFLLAITGTYLYLLPYIMKWQRNQRKKARAATAVPEK